MVIRFERIIRNLGRPSASPEACFTNHNELLIMKKIVFLGMMMVLFFSFKPVDELPIGAAMPKSDVKMKDISGKEVSLKDATRKNGLLVMFSCNTCPYVVKNQQRTKEICKYALDH